MKYDHIVKFGGKYYAAGEDVPEGGEVPSPNKVDVPAVESPANDGQKQYTKTDINKMTTAELQTLAATNGIDGAFEKTGGELKKALIELMGL